MGSIPWLCRSLRYTSFKCTLATTSPLFKEIKEERENVSLRFVPVLLSLLHAINCRMDHLHYGWLHNIIAQQKKWFRSPRDAFLCLGCLPVPLRKNPLSNTGLLTGRALSSLPFHPRFYSPPGQLAQCKARDCRTMGIIHQFLIKVSAGIWPCVHVIILEHNYTTTGGRKVWVKNTGTNFSFAKWSHTRHDLNFDSVSRMLLA